MTATPTISTTTTSRRPSAIDALRGARLYRRLDSAEIAARCHPPKPVLTGSQWADTYGMLPRSTSAEPGRWRTDRAPYQREILDELTSPRSRKVVWVSSSQSGKTACVLKAFGYYVDQDPSPVLIVQPTLEFARDFSRDRLKPEIAETPVLRAKVHAAGGRRDSSDTMLRQAYPGGFATLVGANSATGLSSRPIRVVFCDEIDKYPPSAGDKGDPITLAINRTRTFWHSKVALISTPGIKGVSRIEREWTGSDQRRYYVPCPHCATFQYLEWKQIVFDGAGYACVECGALWHETDKARLLARGEWRATNPDGQYPGFHLSALYSPWTTWADMIARFLASKDAPELLQVFVNEDLAEWWDADGDALDAGSLASRRERYAAEVPMGVGVLTAAVDCHPDWLELLVRGWAAGQESYGIAHHRIRGSITNPATWQRLDDLLLAGYAHESGATMHIALCGIDSGDGETVQQVYGFVAPRQRRQTCPVIATKGLSVRGRPIIGAKVSRPNKYRVRIYPVGTDTAKDVLFARLRMLRGTAPVVPPGLHFPFGDGESFDDEFFEQFSRERVETHYSHGIPHRVYVRVPKGGRNEAIDLEVGNLHALHVLGAAVFDNLSAYAARVQAQGEKVRATQSPEAPADATAPAAAPPPPAQTPAMLMPRGPSGYANARRRW